MDASAAVALHFLDERTAFEPIPAARRSVLLLCLAPVTLLGIGIRFMPVHTYNA